MFSWAMAVTPEEESGNTPYWLQGLLWLAEHPMEAAIVFSIIFIGYRLWKWLSKYVFQEIWIYRMEHRQHRYMGRILRAIPRKRDVGAVLYCNVCNPKTVYTDIYEEDGYGPNFRCTECNASGDDIVEVSPPQTKVPHMDFKVVEQLFPPKVRTISTQKERINYFKKKWFPLEQYPKKRQRFYQRVGIAGRNLYWNKGWKAYEVRDTFQKRQDWKEGDFVEFAGKLMNNGDYLVMEGMNVNPGVVAGFLDDTNIPLPPGERVQ